MTSDDAPPTEVMPGARLFAGRYQVDRPLGRGGMGFVDRAYDTVLGRYVAVKRIAGDAGSKRAARLLREARAVAVLNHPNVVAVYDVGEADGIPFVVMELAEGGSLRARMDQGRVPLERAIGWLRDVADALARAHAAGLVHRDVKPANLLLTEDDRIKVADFGAAKELERPVDTAAPTLAAPGSALTREGHVVGTPRHMAPEQLRGDEIDGRTDQFAWGLVAYELLAGIHPYDAAGLTDAEQVVANGAFVPPPLAPRVPQLPPRVERAVLRALAANPSARAADMGEVRAALEEGAPATVRLPPPAPRPVAPPAARPRKASSIGVWIGVGLVALGALAAVFLFFAVRSTREKRLARTAASASASVSRGPAVSRDPTAQATYWNAIALRDQGSLGAKAEFEAALRADPELAQARVQLAWLELKHDAAYATKQFGLARAARARLSPNDLPLLDALDPLLMPARPDYKRAADVLAQPKDREASCALAIALADGGDAEAAERAFTACEALDARLDVRRAHALYLYGIGEDKRGATMLDACVEAGGNACLYERMLLERDRGLCKNADEDARRLANAKYSSDVDLFVAEARFGNGADRALVLDALRRFGANERHRPHEAVLTAMLDGDLRAAGAALAARFAGLEKEHNHALHAAVATTYLEVLDELEDASGAGGVARTYFSREPAWSRALLPPEQTFLGDPAARLIRAERVAGLVTRDAARADVDARLHADGRTIAPQLAWLWGPGTLAVTREEAAAAIAEAAPRAGPNALGLRDTSLALGRVYALAGDDATAEKHLRARTQACKSIEHGASDAQAWALLGEVLERRGARTEACGAYAHALERFKIGASLRKATAGAARLACPRAKKP